MDRKLDGIDHVIVGVRDLEAARERFARLGFNTTPRGRHVGWGTANYCVMLENDYLELLGIVDPGAFTNNLDRFLEEREGLLSAVLRSRDAEGTHAAWAAAGLAPAPPRRLGRLLEAADGPRELRFRNVMLGTDAAAGLSLFATEHLTPEFLRRPAWLAHPNGARHIRSCTVVADDPAPLAAAMARLVGSSAVTETDRVVAVHCGRGGVILIAPPEDATLMHPSLGPPAPAPRPELRALTIEVADPARAAAFLRLQGVVFRETPEGALIPPSEAHGVALELVR